MTQWTSISFKRKARKARGKETTRAKESTKARAKERASNMRRERVLGKASQIKKNSKTGHNWSDCWAKGGGATKQANLDGETETTGDVNWIMMVQDLSVGQSSTSEIETWRCSGASFFFFAKAHTSHKCPSMQSQIALFPIPMLHSMLQNQVRHSRAQLNPVILSNRAKLVVDSGCFDHC